MKKILMTLAAMAFMAAPAMAAPTGSPTSLPTNEGGGLKTQQYHSYDGLICTDCHTLHASDLNSGFKADVGNGNGDGFASGDGATSDSTNYTYNGVTGNSKGYRELLKKGDWTDMCLSCHKEGNNTSATADLPSVVNGGWKAPIVMTLDGARNPTGVNSNPNLPAGDFYWSNVNPKKGHNPAYSKDATSNAPTSLLMKADTVLYANAPGNSNSNILTNNDREWSCHSCHGMHARFSDSYSAWRQLKRKVNGVVVTGNVVGSGVESISGNATQTAGWEPIKSNSRGDIVSGSYVNVRPDGMPVDGANLWLPPSDTNKNVYRGGFSAFCAACHGNFHGGDNENELTATLGLNNGNTITTGGVWLRHPTNIKMGMTSAYGASRKYGINTYRVVVKNQGGTDNGANPIGYDWKYPLVKPDADSTVRSSVASATDSTTLSGDDRIMCLTCHKAHASEFENMTRWDTNAHAFLANGSLDHEGKTTTADNLAYGCGKCHQKGGTQVFIKQF